MKKQNNLLFNSNDDNTEIFGFEILSGKFGETFFDTPKRKRKVEDYGRLIGICIIFDFRRTLLALFNDSVSKMGNIMEYLKTEGKKPLVVESWINEAIDNISDDKLKEYAIEIWESKKSKIAEKDFDISKML